MLSKFKRRTPAYELKKSNFDMIEFFLFCKFYTQKIPLQPTDKTNHPGNPPYTCNVAMIRKKKGERGTER